MPPPVPTRGLHSASGWNGARQLGAHIVARGRPFDLAQGQLGHGREAATLWGVLPWGVRPKDQIMSIMLHANQ